jgi:hypothetical protein
MKKRYLVLVPMAFLLFLSLGLAQAQGPAPQVPAEPQAQLGDGFTYQGQLKDGGGSPVSSTCDFTFSLWDATSGGAQVGGDSTVTGVSVSDGYFAAAVNAGGEFGTDAFDGEARWLQIAVQCTGDANPVTLDPRQPLTAAPYALSLQPGATISGTVTGGSSLMVINNDPTGAGLFGYNSASSGTANGLLGSTESTEGTGVFGYASSSSGTTAGLSGRANSPDGSGVYGYNTASSGNANGLFGHSESTEGSGVFGYASSSSGSTYGLSGRANSPDGYGVFGYNTADSGYANGVFGHSESTGGTGVFGYASSSSGSTTGLSGQVNSPDGVGVFARNENITGAALAIGQGAFKVVGAGEGTSTPVFQHRVQTGAGGNICAVQNYATVLDHALINGQPGAILIITANYGPVSVGDIARQPYGVYYDDINQCGFGADRWVIYGYGVEPDPAIALVDNQLFNVMVVLP